METGWYVGCELKGLGFFVDFHWLRLPGVEDSGHK